MNINLQQFSFTSSGDYQVLGLIITVFLVFLAFHFILKSFDIKNPFRKNKDLKLLKKDVLREKIEFTSLLVQSLGGKNNIKELDSCITRLKISVSDINHVDKVQLKKLGAFGVIIVNDNIQVIFGTQSNDLKNDIAEWTKYN